MFYHVIDLLSAEPDTAPQHPNSDDVLAYTINTNEETEEFDKNGDVSKLVTILSAKGKCANMARSEEIQGTFKATSDSYA